MAGYRTDRSSEDIKREIVAAMREMKDPRVNNKLLTVVRVDVAGDLSFAKVYVSSLDGMESAAEAVKALKSAAGFIKREVGKNLKLRIMPELRFIADNSIERGAHISKLIKDANER